MDSSGHQHQHLDATTDREVVFCHACSHEWYREDSGIVCPSCGSDITEIISPDNDPRFESASASSEDHPLRLPVNFDDDDSDPDEADIEEHIGPHGFHFRRITRDENAGQRQHDPGLDPVLERFFGMIHGLAQSPHPQPRGGAFQPDGDRRFGEPHVHSTIFTTGNTTSVTFVSGPANHNLMGGGGGGGGGGGVGSGSPGSGRRVDPFQTFFSSVMRDMGSPENEGAGSQGAPGGPAPTFARGLAEIIAMFNPANAVAGDAVYSQEALDRIITNLMEAHPQSNAAPPASAESLANLERRPVDVSLLAGEEKTDCTICIDDMKIGEMAAFLPCKHWFHEDCVVLWLKEHNTCPVCRASIEKKEVNSNGRDGARHNAMSNNDNSSSSSQSYVTRRSGTSENTGGYSPISIMNHRPAHLSRPPSQSQTRLNEVLRNMTPHMSERERERERERDRDRDRDVTEPFGFSFDTSRLQRRNSLSPSSPRQSMPGDYRRMRERSPSQSSSRLENRNAEQSGRSSGSGPLSWIRDTFTGRGSSNSNHESNRDRR